MRPRRIEIRCPKCRMKSKPIPVDMGDKTIKCQNCGEFIRFRHRTHEIEIIDRPERVSSSGLTFC